MLYPPPEIQAGFYPIDSQSTILAIPLNQSNPLEFPIPILTDPLQKKLTISLHRLMYQLFSLFTNASYVKAEEANPLFQRENALSNVVFGIYKIVDTNKFISQTWGNADKSIKSRMEEQ